MLTKRNQSSWGVLFTVLLVLGLTLVLVVPSTQAASIVVDTTSDDDTVNGNCTLREAMIAARDNVTKDACLAGGTTDTISFNINAGTDPGCNVGTGICTIQPLTSLPLLYGSGNITIDGYTQKDASPASGSTPAEIRIELDGSQIGGSPNGIYISSPSNVIRGLAVNQFSTGIVLAEATAVNNSVQGCYIGTDATGIIDRGNGTTGISISSAGSGNQIGGTLSEHRNIIAGNGVGSGSAYGISISSSSTDAIIVGNYIGTTPDGLSALPNDNGIQIQSSAYANMIGGSTSGARNVISGNTLDGITLNGSFSDPHSNTIKGNFIGVDRTGGTALANGGNGLQLINGAFANVVGPGNVISGNAQNAVLIWTAGTIENMVVGNYIGTDASGTAAIPNAAASGAVFINNGAAGNVIGGDAPGEGNLISGNAGQGVRIVGSGTDSTVVSGNIIGLDVTGTSALLNSGEGVYVAIDAANTIIGGDTSVERNVIAANLAAVKLESTAHNNTVSGNYLGTDITGTVGMSVGTGVSIGSGANNNTIGGATVPERNIISGNGGRGINIFGLATDNNQVLGNYIGVDVFGSNPLSNPSGGIQIWNSAQYNTIGPNNIIANNGLEGIRIFGADTDFNFFTQNSIYNHSNYNIALPYVPDGSNEDITPPTITAVSLSPLSVSGTTAPICVGCTIEVFTSPAPSSPAAGKTFLGSDTTDGSGNWTVSTPGLHGPYISATLTDASKGTSMYSNRVFTTITATYLPLIMR